MYLVSCMCSIMYLVSWRCSILFIVYFICSIQFVPHIIEVDPYKPTPDNFYISYCSSGFQNYEGMINWAFLLLGMGGLRLFLENVNK